MKEQNQNNVKNNKGITLIALIITIIILLILAMVSISLVMNSGIISRAEKGVNNYLEEEIKEKIQLAYSDYKMAKATNESYTMQDAINNAGLEGATVEETETGWTITVPTKDGEKVYTLTSDGTAEKQEKQKTLADYGAKVGDYINYDCYTGAQAGDLTYTSPKEKTGHSADQTFKVTSANKDMKWIILGIENGNILITTEKVVFDQNSKAFYLYGKLGYLNGVDELNKIGAIYGHGKYALSGKSIKDEDLFDPSEYSTYGRQYTIKRTETGRLEIDGSSKIENTCNYYDEINREWKSLEIGGSISVTNTGYLFNNNSLASSDNPYWAASACKYVNPSSPSVDYGITIIDNYITYGGAAGFYLFSSISSSGGYYAGYGYDKRGIRPVVSLQSNLNLTKDADGVWQISE